jgi:hypothetical protein
MQALVGSMVPWALPGVVIVTALGALLMCLLVVRYGLTALADTGGETSHEDSSRRALAVRFGHAAAGVCFAVAAMLGVVALVYHARAVVTVARSDDADRQRREQAARVDEHAAEIGRLRQDVQALQDRLAAAESQAHTAQASAADAQAKAAEVQARAAEAQARAAAVQARVEAGTRTFGDLEARLRALEGSARQAVTEAGRALSSVRQLERSIVSAPPPPAGRVLSPPPSRPAPMAVPATPRPPAAPQAVPPAASVDTGPVVPHADPPARPAPDRDDFVRPDALLERRAPDAKASGKPGAPTARAAATPARRDHAPVPVTQRGVGGPPVPDSPSLVDKFRTDWEQMKKDASTTNGQLRDAWQRLRDWVGQ